MQLHRINPLEGYTDSQVITAVVGARLYFVHDGRNAWHSTWVQRYFEGCLHMRLTSAQEYCEANRKRGSVFYIEELPAIRIECQFGITIVTQININNPLSGYRLFRESESETEEETHHEHQANIFRIGEPMKPAVESFVYNSRSWRLPIPDAKSILIAWRSNVGRFQELESRDTTVRHNDLAKPDLLDSAQLYKYVSSSSGGEYELGWDKLESKIRTKGVFDILSEAGYLAEVVGLCPSASQQRSGDA